MKSRYVFLSLLFLVSFISAQGCLNENHYIKLFAFCVVFVILIVAVFIEKNRLFDRSATVLTRADVYAVGLSAVYLYFCIGICNMVDQSIVLIYFLFYFFARLNRFKGDSIALLSDIAPIVIAVHLLICILQSINILSNYNSYFSVASTFGNPDMLAAYLVVLLPFCYAGGNRWKAFRYIVLVGTILAFFLLQARTAIVATGITLLIYFILKKKIPFSFLVVGIVLILMGTVLLVCWHYESFLGRVFIWIVSLSMILVKPFGWGLHAFEKYYPEYQADFVLSHPGLTEALNADVVHSPYNEFLHVGVTLGIIGLIFYLLFVVYTLKAAYKAKSPLLFPLISFQIVSLSYFPLGIIPLAIIYIFFCSLIVDKESATDMKKRRVVVLEVRRRKLLTFFFTVAFLICSSCSLYAYGWWWKSISYSRKLGTYDLACVSFEACYPFMRSNGRFLVSYAELRHNMNDTLATFELMRMADDYFSDIAFLHNLAILYEKHGNIPEAECKFNIAANMAPNDPRIAYARILFLQRIGEMDQACCSALKWNEKLRKEPMKSRYKMISAKIGEFVSEYSSVPNTN